MLDFGITDHIYNSQDTFINFCLMRKKACTAIEERIIFYGQGNIIKNFIHFDIKLTNVSYISILVNNLYCISRLYCCR